MEVKNKISKYDLEQCRRAQKIFSKSYEVKRYRYNAIQAVRYDRVSKQSIGHVADPTAEAFYRLENLNTAQERALQTIRDTVPRIEAWLQEVAHGTGEFSALIRWHYIAGLDWSEIDAAFPKLYKQDPKTRRYFTIKGSYDTLREYEKACAGWLYTETLAEDLLGSDADQGEKGEE